MTSKITPLFASAALENRPIWATRVLTHAAWVHLEPGMRPFKDGGPAGVAWTARPIRSR